MIIAIKDVKNAAKSIIVIYVQLIMHNSGLAIVILIARVASTLTIPLRIA